MDWILTHYTEIFATIGAIVTAASAIVALTPTKKDDEVLRAVIEFLSKFSVFNPKTK